MRPPSFFSVLLLCASTSAVASATADHPLVVDAKQKVKYRGLIRNGIEVFLNIPYGKDTSGANRFKPPVPFAPQPGSTIDAQAYGPACPQPLDTAAPPLTLTNITDISEDCLNLNVARPRGLCADDRLPVMVYIHGGGFWSGSNQELTTAPDGMILESIANGLPVIHVGMNYRLGFFGFSQSDALKSEGSENAGLRDQRLAIDWVRDNIEHFGGDPKKITIFGQSSGGLAVGMQIMAYGGSKPVPFQQGICESQALEPGITGTFAIDAFALVVDAVGCNATATNSPETVACLRGLGADALQAAAESTYVADIAHNGGDIWLPAVDGDFLPAAPSALIARRRFANVTAMMGWCQDDVALFTDTSIATPADARAFLAAYIPNADARSIDALLALYPESEFAADPAANLSASFHRAARAFRDILMACEPVLYGAALSAAGNDVFLYDWNQTVLTAPLATAFELRGLGVVHTSEFAYVFGNVSHYDVPGLDFVATPSDYGLARRAARSWTTFASLGKPGARGRDTFHGFAPAFDRGLDQSFSVFVAGGPGEGLSAVEGPGSRPEIAVQKLRERCAFINSDEFVAQLGF
ncbi:carboxylesterase family protein [Hypoxylon sp. NC1633]|nr:carboxylesterase family protein [Hypoxylon sp. NC1633]